MKTAKKIFSLLLVAVLMLSAIPFQALADEVTPPVHKVSFFSDGWKGFVEVDAATYKLKGAAPSVTKEGHEFLGWSIGGQLYTDIANQGIAAAAFADSNGEKVAQAVAAWKAVEPEHTCSFVPGTVVAPTCKAGGYTEYTCTCGAKENRDHTDKLDHSWSAWAVETAATHDQAGMEVRKCGACGEEERRPLNQLTFTVTFYVDGSVYTTQQWLRYETVPTLPTPAEILNKDFMGWYTAPTGGTKLEPGSEWSGSCTTYYARYEDSVHDGQSKINVYFRLYSEGVAQGQARKLTSFQVADYTSLASALNGKKADFANQLAGLVDLNMYEIADGYYVYNPSTGKETAMASDAKVNGDNSVLIKLVANKSARATVMVFVHSKVEAAATYTYTMAGYTTSDTVFKADVENLLKSKGKNYTINGMFSDNMWERKMAGYTTDPVSALSIEDDGLNGVLKIHVLAPKFSAGTSKAADKTNPATGDTAMIEVTAAVMLLSAAAVVTLTQLRKKKMI